MSRRAGAKPEMWGSSSRHGGPEVVHLTGSDATSALVGGGRSSVAPGRAFEPADASRLSRYGKRADLIVHEHEPFNAETGLAALAEGPVTATDAFYVRGHGRLPRLDHRTWRRVALNPQS